MFQSSVSAGSWYYLSDAILKNMDKVCPFQFWVSQRVPLRISSMPFGWTVGQRDHFHLLHLPISHPHSTRYTGRTCWFLVFIECFHTSQLKSRRWGRCCPISNMDVLAFRNATRHFRVLNLKKCLCSCRFRKLFITPLWCCSQHFQSKNIKPSCQQNRCSLLLLFQSRGPPAIDPLDSSPSANGSAANSSSSALALENCADLIIRGPPAYGFSQMPFPS